MDCEHVLDAGLAEATDAERCKYAIANERIIISKDEELLLPRQWTESEFSARLGSAR
jgi:predicted nuclease of predicted toxin-antitoxin system